MYSVTTQFLQAIRSSYTVEYRANSYRSGLRTTPAQWQATGLPIVTGSVDVDASAQTRRSLTLEIGDPDFLPQTAQDLLAPYGSELHIEWGLRYPNGQIEWVSLGWFVINVDSLTNSSQDGISTLSMTGADRMQWVIDDRFEASPAAGHGLVVNEIAALIADAMPAHVPGLTDRTGSQVMSPGGVWDDHDRAGAVDELATSINAVVYLDPDGGPILAPVPNLTAAPVWTIDSGDNGVKIAEITSVDRSNIYNAVVCTGDSADGNTTAYAVARDTNPASATRWGGPFGKKPAFFSSPVLTSASAAQGCANTILSQYTGAGWTLNVTSAVNPALEVGDIILVHLDNGTTQKHIIDSFSVALDETSALDITTRSNDPDGG